jgi:hypothetical protein
VESVRSGLFGLFTGALLLSAGFVLACSSDDLNDDLDGAPDAIGTRIDGAADEVTTRVSGPTERSTPVASSSQSSSAASVQIESPKSGDRVRGRDVTLKVDVDNFELQARQGGGSGSGQLLYFMDELPMGATKPMSAVASTSTEHTFRNVTPGRHTFGVQLIDGAGNAIGQPKTVTVEVELAF